VAVRFAGGRARPEVAALRARDDDGALDGLAGCVGDRAAELIRQQVHGRRGVAGAVGDAARDDDAAVLLHVRAQPVERVADAEAAGGGSKRALLSGGELLAVHRRAGELADADDVPHRHGAVDVVGEAAVLRRPPGHGVAVDEDPRARDRRAVPEHLPRGRLDVRGVGPPRLHDEAALGDDAAKALRRSTVRGALRSRGCGRLRGPLRGRRRRVRGDFDRPSANTCSWVAVPPLEEVGVPPTAIATYSLPSTE
jgi:hypothetical protein